MKRHITSVVSSLPSVAGRGYAAPAATGVMFHASPATLVLLGALLTSVVTAADIEAMRICQADADDDAVRQRATISAGQSLRVWWKKGSVGPDCNPADITLAGVMFDDQVPFITAIPAGDSSIVLSAETLVAVKTADPFPGFLAGTTARVVLLMGDEFDGSVHAVWAADVEVM